MLRSRRRSHADGDCPDSRAGSSSDRKVPIPASVVELLRTELPTDPDALAFPSRKGSGAYLPLGELRWAFDKGLGGVRARLTASVS